MDATKLSSEATLYPVVEKWMRRHFRCFKAGIKVGLRYSTPDVLGIRDVGGRLAGEVETIAIEVKRGTQPFATASGQALGYQIYVNKVYLADKREGGFDQNELEIASHLGIGLIQIKGAQCREVLSSPHHLPMTRMALELVERLALGKCQLCGTFFEIGSSPKKRDKVARQKWAKAVEDGKGLLFWNFELADRKFKMKFPGEKAGYSNDRRYLCADCVWLLFGPISESNQT